MEIGEVYFPEKSSWVRADVWSAKKFLSEHESRRKLMVKVLDREIARYSLCVKEKREVGILLRVLIKRYLRSLRSLTAVFNESEWPDIFSLRKRLEEVTG